MKLPRLYIHGLTILTLGLLCSFSLHAYNGVDLLQSLLEQGQEDSKTIVRYRGIKRHSSEYKLLQGAIDQGFLRNKRILIKLNEEFTPRSLQRFVKLTSNLSLQLETDQTLDQHTREQVIAQIRANAYPRDPQLIKQELTRLIEQNPDRHQARINHLLSLLGDDPYAQSLSGTQLNNFDQSLQGSFIGLGIGIARDIEGNALITELFDGPAKRHGIQQGDILVRINNTIIGKKTSLTLISDIIKESEKPDIHVAILRGSHIQEYIIPRETITINPISVQQLTSDAILMRIRSFQTNSYEHFIEKIPNLQQTNHIVIDLRDNLGGELNNTTEILHHFIPANQAIYHIREQNTITPVLSKGHEPMIDRNTHIDLLINSNTASAAEIFASSIYEYFPSSRLIGGKSYGKGTIQSVWTTQHQAIKFTTGERLLPRSQRSIDHIGLTPDLMIKDNPLTATDEVITTALTRPN